MASLLASRLCTAPALRTSAGRFLVKPVEVRSKLLRTFADENKNSWTRVRRTPTLKERAMAPPGPNAFGIGRGAAAGGALVGIGALCYYGFGLSKQAGLKDSAMLWPQYVKDRIKTTYMYVGSSLAITAASAMAAFRSPAVLNLVSRGGFLAIGLSLAAIMGTGILAQSIEYREGFGPKQMAWLLHTGVMGTMLAPLCFLGGPVMVRAAWYTAGIVGGLTTVAVCAPSEKFLSMGAPLAMGLGVVFAASLASMFLPPTTALGAGIYSISLYGGLLLFSGFLLYDTQAIVARAERHPVAGAYGVRQYDPINNALSLYMDILNIFIRIATILSGGGGHKRR